MNSSLTHARDPVIMTCRIEV